MAKKRKDAEPPRPKGRPKGKGVGRITSRYAIVATPEYRAWMEQFLEHLGESEISDVYRDAIRAYAEAKRFRSPPSR